MSESCQSSVKSYNKFLRQSALEKEDLTISLQSLQEQELALETILTFVQLMKHGKILASCRMEIKLHFGESERSLL